MCVGSPLGECVHPVRDEDVGLALAVAADEPVQAGRHDLLTPEITSMHYSHSAVLAKNYLCR